MVLSLLPSLLVIKHDAVLGYCDKLTIDRKKWRSRNSSVPAYIYICC